jgi:hypothetical protein
MAQAPVEQQWVTCIVAALRQIGHEAYVEEIEAIAGPMRGEYQVSRTPVKSASEMLQLHCINGPTGLKGTAIFFKCDAPAVWDLVERRQQGT